MKKEEKPKTQRNLSLLIILFFLISLTLFTGRFLMGAPGKERGAMQASTSIQRPQILRMGEEENADESLQTTAQPLEDPVKPVEIEEDSKIDYIDARLFFYKLDDQGQIVLKSVLRPLPTEVYGIKQVITEILQGPSGTDLDKGYLSLIPVGSKLNGVKIVSRTARLDFSEEFCFNPLGYEGFNAQIKQLVYTVTEFNNIDQVLFTIDGELRDYINGEGMYTGEPLSRESLQHLGN